MLYDSLDALRRIGADCAIFANALITYTGRSALPGVYTAKVGSTMLVFSVASSVLVSMLWLCF